MSCGFLSRARLPYQIIKNLGGVMNNVTLCAKRRARLIAVIMADLAAGIATQGQAEERRYMLDLPLVTRERALTKLSLQYSQPILFSPNILYGRTHKAQSCNAHGQDNMF